MLSWIALIVALLLLFLFGFTAHILWWGGIAIIIVLVLSRIFMPEHF